MPLNEKQIHDLVESCAAYSKDLGWSDKDANIALGWVSITLLVLNSSGLPTAHPKYPEVLRMLANLFEARNEADRSDTQ